MSKDLGENTPACSILLHCDAAFYRSGVRDVFRKTLGIVDYSHNEQRHKRLRFKG
jgi:hypothetical protein